MIPLLHRALPTTLRVPTSSVVKIVCEPSVGSVIPDLLVGVVHRRPRILAANHFTAIEESILALLEQRGSTSEGEIADLLYLPASTCGRSLGMLARVGAVLRKGDRMWRISHSAVTCGVEVVAIEAKLRLWRKALAQAQAYRVFANQALVVLDGNQVQVTEELRREFSAASVGLWLQWGRAVQEVIPSVRHNPVSAERFRAVGKLLRSKATLRQSAAACNVHPTLECV